MDVSSIVKSVFILLSVVAFFLLVTSAYRYYQQGAKIAALGDAASSIATELALDELAFEDQAGVHAYVVDQATFTTVRNFTRSLGGENYRFYFEVGYRDGSEIVLGPFGGKPPAGIVKVSLVLPVAVFENFRLLEGRLKVVVW